MSDTPQSLDHLSVLKKEAGPTIVGRIIADTDQKVSILTIYGIYEVTKSEVALIEQEDATQSRVTITRGAKILFSQLIDAESLLPRNRASLAHVAQGAKQLQSALNRVLGKTELPIQNASPQISDCPMSDCTDCCQCPVIGDVSEAPGRTSIRMEYYERQIGRAADDAYRSE